MKSLNYLSVIAILGLLVACGKSDTTGTETAAEEETPAVSMVADNPMDNPMEYKGIGPITELTLPDVIDEEMAQHGKLVYDSLCTACHKADQELLGPSPQGIFDRRNPEWVMNLILNPDEMLDKDPLAKELLEKYNGTRMTNQDVSEEDARAILEYFRTL